MGSLAKDNILQFKELDSFLKLTMEEFRALRKIVSGNPYSDEQKERIEKIKLNPGMFINFYVPTIDTIVGMMYSNNNRVTAIPMGKDPEKAYVWQPVLASLFEDSDWAIIYPEILQDYAILGIGWIGVDVDTDFNPKPLGTRLERIDPFKMRWPLTYNYPMMDDADVLMRYEIMTVKQAIIKTGKAFDEEMLENFKDSTDFFEDYAKLEHLGDFSLSSDKIENSRLLYLEACTKETKKYQRLLFKDEISGEVIKTEDIPIDDRYRGAKGEEAFENVYSYFWKLTKSKDGETSEIIKQKVEKLKRSNGLEEVNKPMVLKRVSVGGHDIGTFELPTSRYPWIPLSFNMFETGIPVGVVKNIRPLVHGMNENIHLLLLNGRIANQVRILAPEESISDESLVTQLQETGGVVKYKLKSFPDGSPAKPEIIPPFSISSDFYQLQNMFSELVNVIASINEAMQGEFKGEQPSNITMQSLKESGTAKFKPKAVRAQSVICRAAAVAVDFIKVYSLYDKVLRIVDNEDENEDMYVDQPDQDVAAQQLAMSKGQKIGRKVKRNGYNTEVPINYRVQDGKNTIILNNLKDSENEVDMRMASAPATETARRIWQQGVAIVMNQFPQSSQVLLKEFLKMSEYPQAHKVADKIDTLTNLQGSVQQLTEGMAIMKKRLINLLDQNVRIKQQAASSTMVMSQKSRFDKLYNDYALKSEQMKAGMETDTEADLAELEKKIDEMDELIEQATASAEQSLQGADETVQQEATA